MRVSVCVGGWVCESAAAGRRARPEFASEAREAIVHDVQRRESAHPPNLVREILQKVVRHLEAQQDVRIIDFLYHSTLCFGNKEEEEEGGGATASGCLTP